MKKRMRVGKAAVLFGAFGLMCAMTGCVKTSETAKGSEEDIIRIEASGDESTAQNESTEAMAQIQDESGQAQTEPEIASGENHDNVSDGTQDENELEGSVKSIGEESMVVSKIFTYTEEDGGDVAVEYAGDGPDAVLITVYFSENTEYIVRTVKNGGVNGDADAEDRIGTLSDLQEGNTVMMNGSYEGEDFRAEQVIIYNFI